MLEVLQSSAFNLNSYRLPNIQFIGHFVSLCFTKCRLTEAFAGKRGGADAENSAARA
jgi:hypothetical protein